jgi:uncharacterized protein YndB with AHSA1/START domain
MNAPVGSEEHARALAPGRGCPSLPTKPGQPYETPDGTTGEVRSYRPGDRLRLNWRPDGWTHDSTLQLAVTATGPNTVVRFHHERLANQSEREAMRDHWTRAMDALAPLLD